MFSLMHIYVGIVRFVKPIFIFEKTKKWCAYMQENKVNVLNVISIIKMSRWNVV